MRLNPMPGYVICKPYKLENKAGAFHLPDQDKDPDKAPEFGEIIEIGSLLPVKKMPWNPDHVPKVGDKIAYKKFNYFTHTIAAKQYAIVHFENILYKIENNGNETKSE